VSPLVRGAGLTTVKIVTPGGVVVDRSEELLVPSVMQVRPVIPSTVLPDSPNRSALCPRRNARAPWVQHALVQTPEEQFENTESYQSNGTKISAPQSRNANCAFGEQRLTGSFDPCIVTSAGRGGRTSTHCRQFIVCNYNCNLQAKEFML